MSDIAEEDSKAVFLGTWVVNWDVTQGLKDLEQNMGLFDEVHIFGAYFNEKDEITLASEWSDGLGKIPLAAKVGNRPRLVLTVVNDLISLSGNIQKDPKLVHRILANAVSRERHIAELVTLASSLHFNGIEIDYENVSETDWPKFLEFISVLQTTLARRDLTLQIVLQPNKKYFKNPLPPGIRYSIMGYNLHGGHSGPGPKADPAFLIRLANMVRKAGILDNCALALATGGFEWFGERQVINLTENQAVEVAQKNKDCIPERHEPDGYLVCRYLGDDGQPRELWYADSETLQQLWRTARVAGFSQLYIWRLGGNSPDLFTTLRRRM